MNLKNVSTGGGLALLAVAVLANAGASLLSTFSSQAHADATTAGRAVVASAMAQGGGEPTIVWYGTVEGGPNALLRAWSNGLVEYRTFDVRQYGGSNYNCQDTLQWVCEWKVLFSPNDGLAAFADLNADAKVDAQDLAQVLSRWGDAPRNDIPPSDCPLNLVNP
jgi:hypothetical protein